MSPQKIAELEAQINALDQETAYRVTRLVMGCGASLQLALQAVQDADDMQRSRYGESKPMAYRILAAVMNGAKALQR